MISSHFLMTITRFQNLAFFHFFFFPKFYTSSVSYFLSPNFFFLHFHELNQHTISERWKIGFDWKKKMNQNKTLRVFSHFMDEDSYVQFEKLKSKNEIVKLTLCCVVFLFSCNKQKNPLWFVSRKLTDGTNGFAG